MRALTALVLLKCGLHATCVLPPLARMVQLHRLLLLYLVLSRLPFHPVRRSPRPRPRAEPPHTTSPHSSGMSRDPVSLPLSTPVPPAIARRSIPICGKMKLAATRNALPLLEEMPGGGRRRVPATAVEENVSR
jgi:hypothetical protein